MTGNGRHPGEDLATELIEGIVRIFPHHAPGTRPIHSYGVVARGRFQPSAVVRRLTKAAVFVDHAEVDVTVRFSNGTGNSGSADSGPSVQGMAVRFHPRPRQPTDDRLPSADRNGPGWDDATHGSFDLVATTLPVFYVHRLEAFRGFLAAAVPPDPPRRRPWWRPYLDGMNFRRTPKHPHPGDAGVLAYSARHPETCPALAAQFGASFPESFATRSYHAAHAFRLSDAAGPTCHVRFTWEPVAGVRNQGAQDDPGPDCRGDRRREPRVVDLRAELTERGRRGGIHFVLRATVAEQGDDVANPARPWPKGRRRLVLGLLILDGFAGDDGEDLEFNPHNLPEGIEVDQRDEIFHVRNEVYATSARWRKAQQTGGGGA